MATSKKGGAKSAAAGIGKVLKVAAPPNAKLPSLARAVERAFGKTACRGCRSGIDRIVFEDPAMQKIK